MKKKPARKTKRPAKKAASKPKAEKKSTKPKGGEGGAKAANQPGIELEYAAENSETKGASGRSEKCNPKSYPETHKLPYTIDQVKDFPPLRKAVLAGDKEPFAFLEPEAIAFTKTQIEALESVLNTLTWISMAAFSKQADLAAASLAEHFVRIGKEYHRATSTNRPAEGNSPNTIQLLLTFPEFRKHFERHRKVRSNHEGASTKPAMQVIVRVVHELEDWSGRQCISYFWGEERAQKGAHTFYCDAIHRIAGLFGRCGRGGDKEAESWWAELVYPRLLDRWEEFTEVYGEKLPTAKGRSKNSRKKPKKSVFRSAFLTLWAERQRRFEVDPDAPRPHNHAAIAYAMMHEAAKNLPPE